MEKDSFNYGKCLQTIGEIMQLPNNRVAAFLFIIFIWWPVACILIVADYIKNVLGIEDKDDDTDYQSVDEKEREIR